MPTLTRRTTLATGAALLAASAARAQKAELATPASVVTSPPRQWGPGAQPSPYPDPDILVLDPSFKNLLLGITTIRRVATGFQWAEGPAWSAQGNFLVFSDVQANTQYRLTWETGHVSPYRKPSYNSNGNAFDYQGRQLSTEDFFRRLIRWEHDGTLTVLADSFDGKHFNSPNDLVPHHDGSIWFTDPGYGTNLSEGHPDAPGGPTNPGGEINPAIGAENAGLLGGTKRELPGQTYRLDTSGRLDVVANEDQIPDPNGLCFSPDQKTLYLISTGKAPGDTKPGGKGQVFALDVADGKLTNQRVFTDMHVDGVTCGPDGMRADVFGNLWISSNAPLGYSGVLVFNPGGKLIGRVRLPEVCANLTFGGPKRNVLYMTASQSIYTLQVQTQGAAPG